MPLPGEQITAEPFTDVMANNAALLQQAGLAEPGSGATGGPFPAGLAPAPDPSIATGLPDYLTNAGAYFPAPPDPALALAGKPAFLKDGETADKGEQGKKKKCSSCGAENAADALKCKRCEKPLVGHKARDLSVEHQAVIYNTQGLNLATTGDDGLLWKVACKTGTLALSPGPGAVDIDQPLVLTRELFDDMVLSAQEQAFPYITVPETHANGALENTGYVRAYEVLDRETLLADQRLPEKHRTIIEGDPDDTQYLLAGIEFTEPDVKARAERGSIPDTSIGVKFGYRNKRTGKTYKAAWEHLALTPMPWVDGLVPFGLSQDGVPGADDPSIRFDGVYVPMPNLDASLQVHDGDAKYSQQPKRRRFGRRKKGMELGIAFDESLHPRIAGKFAKKYGKIDIQAPQSIRRPGYTSSRHVYVAPEGSKFEPTHLGSVHTQPGAGLSGGKVHAMSAPKPGKPSVKVGGEHESIQHAVAALAEHHMAKDDTPKSRAAERAARDADVAATASGTYHEGRGSVIYGDPVDPKTLNSMQQGQIIEVGNGKAVKKTRNGWAVRPTDNGPWLPLDPKTTTAGVRKRLGLSQDGNPSDGLDLSADDDIGLLPGEHRHDPREEEMPTITVEELLAQQQAELEASQARIAALEADLALSQGTISAQGEQLHTDAVTRRVRQLQAAGYDPALCLAVKNVMLADKARITADEGMNLSVQAPTTGADGKITAEERKLNSASDIVEYLLSAMPSGGTGNEATRMAGIHTELTTLHASAHESANDEDAKRAAVEALEKQRHPERFDADGKRI